MTSTTTGPAAGSTTTSTGSKVLALALSETRLMLRNRTVAVSAVFIPLVMGAFFAYSFTSSGGEAPSPFVFAMVVASQLAVVVGMTVYVTTTTTVVARRHTRVLKRMRTSGISDAGLLVATITPTVVVGVLQMLLFVPFNAYSGMPVPADPVALVLAAVGGLALCVTAALATTVVTSTPERAQITTLPLVFVLLGAAIVLAIAPLGSFWQAFVGVPGAAVGQLSQLAMTGGTWAPGLAGLPAAAPALLASVIWPVVFGMLALRKFRWDPRH